ncbi:MULTISPECIES: ribosome small subunit-dependent GTPase A [unclassified Mesorhizobium]|uniref:ribosome small subunit-dependent GTPase A n=1 Tax=unclassified Mesorhizobium TaxID=325217 RepID=UPI000BB0CA03|nr:MULTISPECIES: ribosome small subunit-dependent GTPase A [unclassified Mesorhizobium]PBC24332.1 ribosome small subunit-dependent GTPase A [Mesorhizobium sp. WSM4311]TRD09126.1 ribosome small subunit-dependent GTPase A [Mesorhizobium sp. WSM4305]
MPSVEAVTASSSAPSLSLAGLGWSEFFGDQLEPGDADLIPTRIAMVHRDRLSGLSQTGQTDLSLAPQATTGDYAVGDWVLVEPHSHLVRRRLTRKTVLERRVQGGRGPQLAAANVDTLFIVTSCNADFNIARLERYLALANEAGTTPVILLTKADTAEDAEAYQSQAAALQRGLAVVTLNPRISGAASALAAWCGAGQTVALIGSSGVGKSTLVNSLAGSAQQTGAIREHDAKGRHTTTARSLHAIAGGGWVIDTPGMRTLQVSDVAYGIDMLFAEITELAPLCKFRDCTHVHEPGCAVQAALKAGTLDPDRLARWRKLSDENQHNTPVLTGPRGAKSPAGRGKRR